MRNRWARIRAKYPEPLAEFLCTATSVFLGLTGTLSVNLSQNQSQQYGTYETLCWAWGLAFMFGIYLGGGVSGAHMNPAISVSLAIFRGFPWKRCYVYVLVQIFAAFAGAALAYAIYADAIHQVDPDMTSTYSSFFSVRKPWVSPATGFFNEFLGGAVIMVAVLSLGDDQNNPPGAGMHAFILGLLVTVLKMTLGYNTGASLSPASDLGPRLVAYAAGYKIEPLWKTGWWFYGPWAGTMSGAIVGCTLYDAVVFVGSESPVNYRWSQEKQVWRALFHKKK
ncbi:aquaporin-like protein [Coniella lustricola]|uniref:Aquaporin-like protein n=1 Tax=Coniella lustricola TaxID=2025994 RepID=A0A2T2ZT34_9PEZI|nr:aquaporin-like protein [Coniella lustricola]